MSARLISLSLFLCWSPRCTEPRPLPVIGCMSPSQELISFPGGEKCGAIPKWPSPTPLCGSPLPVVLLPEFPFFFLESCWPLRCVFPPPPPSHANVLPSKVSLSVGALFSFDHPFPLFSSPFPVYFSPQRWQEPGKIEALGSFAAQGLPRTPPSPLPSVR